jgi:hypothetical protein
MGCRNALESSKENGMALNPEWKKYNDFQNEGGEGFNPHQKWIVESGNKKPDHAKTGGYDPLVRNQMGNYVRASALRADMCKCQQRLETVTDETAKEILIKSIEHAKKELGEV